MEYSQEGRQGVAEPYAQARGDKVDYVTLDFAEQVPDDSKPVLSDPLFAQAQETVLPLPSRPRPTLDRKP